MVQVAVTMVKKALSRPSTSRKTIKTKKTEEEDCEYIVCGEFYSNSRAGEDWIQCSRCAKWAHELCTSGVEDAPLYTCDLCI